MITKYPKEYRPKIRLSTYVVAGLKQYVKDNYNMTMEEWLEGHLLTLWEQLNESTAFVNTMPPEVLAQFGDDKSEWSKMFGKEAKETTQKLEEEAKKPTPPPQSYSRYEQDR